MVAKPLLAITRRLGHSRALMCSFLSHSFVAFAVCFRTLSCWNTNPWPFFNALALKVYGPVHRPFDVVQLSCPLSRKTPPKHNVSSSMFDGGDGVLGVIGSIPPPPNTASWCQRDGFLSHLTTTLSPSSPLNHLQSSDRPVHVLSWAGGFLGHCSVSVLHGVVYYQLFYWWLWSQLHTAWDHWKDPPV